MTQLQFDWTALESDEPAYDRWQAFHYANPWVMEQLTKMARTLRAEREQLQAIVKSIGFKKD